MISVLELNQEFYSQTNEPPFSNTKRKTFRKVNGPQGEKKWKYGGGMKRKLYRTS